ncbi:MAG: glycine cleavage system aminomethyltransferase GcvT, partial [Anaerolineae bacterium]|nr:glycine cleavage system aminomethyltransferase GcvT [Anaerolineae bacterium]
LNAGIDFEPPISGYPHFFYVDDSASTKNKTAALDIQGEKAAQFLNFALAGNMEELGDGDSQPTQLSTPDTLIPATLTRASDTKYRLSIPTEQFGLAAAWLRDLSDGFVKFDEQDLFRKLPGPVSIMESDQPGAEIADGGPEINEKPYYIGIQPAKSSPLPEFKWEENDEGSVRKTALHSTHVELGAKMIPFAGWEMPVWYSSVTEEHLAVRKAAGLFDVSHMGVYQAEGSHAVTFLNSVCGNDIASLKVGDSLYTHFLDPNANVIDDLLVYRRSEDKYLMVVNASNDDKDWAWLNAVKEGAVLVDRKQPSSKAFGRQVALRNLRDPKEGKDMLVDIALQGPKSLEILLALGCDPDTESKIRNLKRTELCEAVVGDISLVVSRTGYTGEKICFELFVHPEESVKLWKALMQHGEANGLKPCGLGARDSLRTEAGLPLYGHEMGGENNLSVGDAGFRTYVKTHKPWFVGRDAFLEKEAARGSKVIRFRFNEKGVRMAHLGDPVLDKRGKTIGYVTSCAIDIDGYLTGQAYIDDKNAKRDTPLLIFQSASDKADKAPGALKPGDRTSVPSPALVITRFP